MSNCNGNFSGQINRIAIVLVTSDTSGSISISISISISNIVIRARDMQHDAVRT